ncbi:MAG TPA: hypothetical protein VKV69_03705 [Actinomycetota bacterium]|nr:hypothetical protein [Actinomycetota bacterium]
MADVSFANDILPLFTETDIDHMNDQGVMLADYEYMKDPDNAAAVLGTLEEGSMPPTWGGGGGAWPEDKVALFRSWVEGGYKP